MPRYVEFPKIQTHVSNEVLYLAHQAARRAGFATMAEWHRDLLCRTLAEELSESAEELRAGMPKPWRENPGAVKLSGKSDDKSGV